MSKDWHESKFETTDEDDEWMNAPMGKRHPLQDKADELEFKRLLTELAAKDAEIERLKKLLFGISQKYVFDMLKHDGDVIVSLIEQALKGGEK
jgi:hypothetical protein